MTIGPAPSPVARVCRTAWREVAFAAALALVVAAVMTGGAPKAYACGARVDLRAIETAMAAPGLAPARLQLARDLKARAAKAIKDGHAAEGNGHYLRLMSLLQLDKPAPAAPVLRCWVRAGS